MDWTNRDSASKILIVVVVSIIGLVVLLGLFWGGTGYGMMDGGMMGSGWLFMLVPLLFVILLIFFLVPGLSEEARSPQGSCAPGIPQLPFQATSASVEILSQRYARGEISRDDYLRMRDDIAAEDDCEGRC